MDFWGVEVKSGDPCPVEPGEGRILHLSQACLGEVKKDKRTESVYLYATIDGKKLVLGTLSPEKFPQQQFDLVFNKKFELSHNWKHGSVYFYGYRCDNPIDEITTEDDSEDELEDELPVIAADSGKSKSQAKHEKPPAAESANTAKPVAVGSKQKVKIVEPKKDVKTVEEIGSSDDDFETDSSEYASESDEDEDSDSENEGKTEDDDEDKETPKKVEPSKKRPAESATETPGPDKKAKSITPQITDTKKGNVHVATPHPSKKSGKTPANQPNQQTPKSAGSHPCKSCNRSFNSENALESHTKAKHSAGK
ncbi:hypothetical protein CsSME_00016829 [Camellia sinensis var. sinensis]